MIKGTKIVKVFFMVVLGLFALCGRSLADVLRVPSQYPTIQAGIDAASDGDTVVLAVGVYASRDIDFNGKAITVQSTSPNDPCVVAATIIDCNGTEVEPHRGFYFHSGEDANSILKGLTIKNGHAYDGGGVYCNSASPTIANCNFIDCSAENWGGGVQCWKSSATIEYCSFTGNSASEGGAITTRNNSFSAVYITTIRNCHIYGNSASISGGGINSDCLSTPTISNCTITGNYSGDYGGGGIAIWQSNPTITNCIIVGNSTSGWGSGIRHSYEFENGSRVFNCLIAKNSGEGNDNTGIFCSSTMLVTNSIIGWNIDETPGDWLLPDCDVTFSYCNVENCGGSGPLWNVPFVTDGGGNIDVDPCFADADANDFHLQSTAGRWDPNSESWVTDAVTSPCIDAGNPGCPPGSEPLPNGGRINMGAYGGTSTASKSPADWRSIADLTNDWIVDFNDLAVFVDYWLNTGQCIPSDLNHNGSVDFNDFAVFSRQWSDTPAVGPGITYQIDDCNLETEGGLAVVSQSGELRFSVTVEGSFIHFEDMMVANCCPDELGLEMTVVDSIITIYETEYTPGGCRCICDYPVTATLGPFEPGIYILEVYEDWTGFIGSTIVAIE